MTPDPIDHYLDKVLRAAGSGLHHYTMQSTLKAMRSAMSEAMAAGGRDAEHALRTAHTALAFAIRRLRNNSSSRDTELCAAFSAARADIEKAMLSFGGSLAERPTNKNGNLGKGLPNDPDNVPKKENIGPSGSDVRTVCEWLANHIGGISLMDWDPCANVLLQAADRLDALTTMQGITPEMVNAAWNKGKDLRMTGLPTDFRQVLEAALQAVAAGGWQPIETAPHGKKLIAGYRNEAGKWRTILACYYPAKTLYADGEWGDDEGYAPAGWYEESETHETLNPCAPTHWQPIMLPPPPAEGE